MLKVSPWKVIHFGKRGKLNPRYTRPFKILTKVRTVAYRLELPKQLSRVHIDNKLHFVEEPVKIMDREVKRLKQSRIPIVKVRWNSRRESPSSLGNEMTKCRRSIRIFSAQPLHPPRGRFNVLTLRTKLF
ncbi:hypothetical protein Tco_0661401 [Tanacetum coccineum]